MKDEMFIGRRDEVALFAALLGELTAAPGARSAGWWRRRPSGEDRAGVTRSRVVVVYGLGGSGKSRVLSHFRDMAKGSIPVPPVAPVSPVPAGRVATVWLDWADEQRNDPAAYAAAQGPSVVTVLDAVQEAFTSAFEEDARAGQAFDDYRQGAARAPEYAARFADVRAQSGQSGSPFTSEDATALLKATMSAGLMAVGHPGGVLGLAPDQLAAAAQAGGHLSEAAIQAVTGKKPGEVSPQEYALVTNPAGELTRRVAAAVRAIAGQGPLVILLDTGEAIGDRAWGWLRRIMTRTGPRVAWVIGARFATEADAGADSPVTQFVRDIGDEHLTLMSPARFDEAMIRAYLESRPDPRSYTGAQIDMIARFTGGLPLGVSFTATLLDEGQPVEDACREVDDGYPSSVVSRLARRYLEGADRRTYPAGDPRREDITKILGLALASADLRSDPELLAVLWAVEDPLAAFQDLASRHDFVLRSSRRLHDDVHDTLLIYLLDPWQRHRIRGINQRALALFRTRLAERRSRWPTLDEQLAHSKFTTALLTALWHTLWADDQAGLDLFIQVLPLLAIADPPAADDATAMVDLFARTFDQDQRRDLDLLTRLQPVFPSEARQVSSYVIVPPGPAENHPRVVVLPGPAADDPLVGEPGDREVAAVDEVRRVKITLPGLDLHPPGLAADDPLVGEPGDRQAAVLILRASLQHEHEAAITNLQAAASQTTSTRLRQAIRSYAQEIANWLLPLGYLHGPGDPVDIATGMAAAKLAAQILGDDTSDLQFYAVSLFVNCQFEDALAAYDQALTLDPRYADAHHGRGNALYCLGRFEDALAAYDQVLTLDPRYAGAHYGRGNALSELGRFEDALAAYDQALTLDPRYAGARRGRADALYCLGRFEDALAAYRQALAQTPDDASGHMNKGITLAVTGDFDQALAEFAIADRLAPAGLGEDKVWAGAILWHRRDAAGARDLFALVKGQVRWCTPFRTAEIEAIALCGLGQPDHAEQHLLNAVPLRVPADGAEFRTIYDLLSDPPLPGINRLRTIVDNGT